MTEQTKTCPLCGDDYPADLPQRFWLGPDTCDPCQDRARENYGRWVVRRHEHNARLRAAQN